MRARSLLRFVLVAGAVGFVCAALTFLYLRNRPVDLPRLAGRHAVAREIVHVHGIELWIWYPAESRGIRAPYAPAGTRSWLVQNLDAVRTNSYLEAPPKAAAAELIFVPGQGLIPPYYSSLLEDLASRGYKVIAIHPAESAFPESASREARHAAAERLAHSWADDIRAVMDHEQAATGASRFGVIGHSLGGAAAAEACRVDARCAAAIDLDGRLWNPVFSDGLKRPLLMLLSEPSFADTGAEAAGYERVLATAPGSEILRVRGMRRLNFTDWPLMFNPLARLSSLTGSIDAERGITIARAYVSAFFDRYVRNQDPPLMRGPSPDYLEVIWRR